MQLLGQFWQQSPLTMLMVAGLVSFGMYAVVGYFRARPQDQQPPSSPSPDTLRFETIPHGPQGWHDGTGGVG